MTDFAAGTDNSFSPLIALMIVLVLGGLPAANSRGYGLTKHTFGSYYEFRRAPQQVPPASPGPWQGRP